MEYLITNVKFLAWKKICKYKLSSVSWPVIFLFSLLTLVYILGRWTKYEKKTLIFCTYAACVVYGTVTVIG